ncbi:unnamed protein product [Paramecium primaurelia]|uniref:Uncharacterized protein n=1 Tax=Paramecium primaurelia TaxID=5886 RepID=A0A8S1NZ92_PARPR|nr:unnamed protein product [Paramecium primaurelia]
MEMIKNRTNQLLDLEEQDYMKYIKKINKYKQRSGQKKLGSRIKFEIDLKNKGKEIK